MFADIKSRLNASTKREPIPEIHFGEILCADDTLIFREHKASLKHKYWKDYNMDLYYHNIPQLHQSKYQQENDGKWLLSNTKVETLCPQGSRLFI